MRVSVRAYALALLTPAPTPTPYNHLTGKLPRNLSGNVVGSLTGNLTGTLPRNLSGNLTTHNQGTLNGPVNSTPLPSQIPSQIPSPASQTPSQSLPDFVTTEPIIPDFGRFETEEELLVFMSTYSDRYTTGATPTSTPSTTHTTPVISSYATSMGNLPSSGPVKTGPVKSLAGPTSPVKSLVTLSLFDDKRDVGGYRVYELVKSVNRSAGIAPPGAGVGSVGVGSSSSNSGEEDELALSVCVTMDFDTQGKGAVDMQGRVGGVHVDIGQPALTVFSGSTTSLGPSTDLSHSSGPSPGPSRDTRPDSRPNPSPGSGLGTGYITSPSPVTVAHTIVSYNACLGAITALFCDPQVDS